MVAKNMKGAWLYLLNLPPDDKNKCEYDTITLGKFDSDEEAIAYCKDHYKSVETGECISRVVVKAVAYWELCDNKSTNTAMREAMKKCECEG